MYCSKCGKQSDGVNFCPYCGAEMHKETQQSASAEEAPRKHSKRRVWVFIGISAAVVIAAAAALFFILTHTVEGMWYCEERGEVLTFHGGGTVELASLTGADEADYKYDRLSGQGSFEEGDGLYEFTANGSQIDMGGHSIYKKAGSDFNIDEFLEEYGTLGTWYDIYGGEVLMFGRDGKLQSEKFAGVSNGDFEYDAESEAGVIYIDPFSYKFRIEDGKLHVDGMGVLEKADVLFDTNEFLNEFDNPICGRWYDTEGEGAIDLQTIGLYDLETYGRSIEGTYRIEKNTVIIYYDYFGMDFRMVYNFKNGVLSSDEDNEGTCIKKFVRKYTKQKGKEDLYDEPLGKWRSEYGGMTVEFFDDGKGVFNFPDASYDATYIYEPLGNIGYFTINKGKDVLFVIFEDKMVLADFNYYREDQ